MSAAPAAPAGPGLTVVTYNLKSATMDRDALVATLRRLAPDVLLAQEAPNHPRWRSAAARLARDAGLLYLDGGRPAGTNMLFAQMRVDTVSTWARRWPTPPRDPVRGLVGGLLRCSGRLLGVVGAHYPLRPEARLRYGEAVVAAVTELRRSAPLVLLGADLNEDPGGPAWRQLAAAGLTDTAPAPAPAAGTGAGSGVDRGPGLDPGTGTGGGPGGGAGPGGSAPGPTFPSTNPTHRLDTVWWTGAATVVEAGVPVGAAGDGPVLRTASDHLPWLARLVFTVP